MSDEETDEEPSDSVITLRRIADLLDQPVSNFFEPQAYQLHQIGRDELLKLWDSITDPAARRELLDHARALASSEAGRARLID